MALSSAYSSICPHMVWVGGDTADAPIAVTGMAVGDIIDSIAHVSTATVFNSLAMVDVTSATIYDGGFSLDFDTSADLLQVFWIETDK